MLRTATDPMPKFEKVSQSDPIADLKKIRVILDTKVDSSESLHFKLAMVTIAHQIAEASGPGVMSKLGLGKKNNVDDNEAAALLAIIELLGVTDNF